MPSITQLNEQSIKKVVVMLEYLPQVKIEIEDLKATLYRSFGIYLESLANNGFEVAIRGIDSRFDIDKAKKYS